MKLILKNVSKTYNRKVVDNFSCEWTEPGIHYLEGPSGSGKTTLLRIMAGLEKDFDGKVEVEGKVAAIFQEPRLFPEVSLLENVALVLDDSEKSKENAVKYLSMVGLDDDLNKKAKEASGGMQQRTAFARAFVCEPDILLCDEPFSAQDQDNKQKMEEMINELSKKSIIVITRH